MIRRPSGWCRSLWRWRPPRRGAASRGSCRPSRGPRPMEVPGGGDPGDDPLHDRRGVSSMSIVSRRPRLRCFACSLFAASRMSSASPMRTSLIATIVSGAPARPRAGSPPRTRRLRRPRGAPEPQAGRISSTGSRSRRPQSFCERSPPPEGRRRLLQRPRALRSRACAPALVRYRPGIVPPLQAEGADHGVVVQPRKQCRTARRSAPSETWSASRLSPSSPGHRAQKSYSLPAARQPPASRAS